MRKDVKEDLRQALRGFIFSMACLAATFFGITALSWVY